MATIFQPIREQRVRRALASLAALGPKKKVLDIGCQSGGFCGKLLELGHEAFGLEIVPEMVENARRNYPTIPFVVGDSEQHIPFPDGFFDVVWAGDVIEHIRHTDVFVNEVNRVLHGGGHFIVSTPMHNRLKNLYIVLFRFEKHFDPEFPHYRFYTKKSLSAVLEKRGFEVVEVDFTGRLPVIANTLFVVARKTATKAVMSEARLAVLARFQRETVPSRGVGLPSS
jgi:SAM-dependent methyltransferase